MDTYTVLRNAEVSSIYEECHPSSHKSSISVCFTFGLRSACNEMSVRRMARRGRPLPDAHVADRRDAGGAEVWRDGGLGAEAGSVWVAMEFMLNRRHPPRNAHALTWDIPTKKCDNELDPELWSNLQYHIDLERVYERLPVKEFFQFRVVCKEWNRLAGDIEFLESTFKDRLIRKPFFLLEPNFLVGDDVFLLACVDLFGKWSTTRLPWYFSNCQAVEGMVCYTVPQTGQLKVLNLHTRVWNTLYPNYPREDRSRKFLSAMYVDTSVRPYAWKIILGGIGMECTRIYDSTTNKWTIKGAGLHPSYDRAYQKGLASSKDAVYVQYSNIILAYDLQEDVWTALNVPYVTPRGSFIPAGIGAWQGRVFLLADECVWEPTRSICVWEHDEVTSQGWAVYSWMPIELYAWVRNSAHVNIRASYCTGYFVLYVWLCHKTRPAVKVSRFVLFNLATKEWRKARLPYGAIENSGKRKLALLP